MPLWLTVLLLLLTRIEPLGLRENIRSPDPHFTIHLGSFLHFKLSAWLVVQVRFPNDSAAARHACHARHTSAARVSSQHSPLSPCR